MSTESVSYAELEWEFADRIRKVRRKIARMEQTEMAVVLGVSQKVYATWESGRSKPGDIVKIAKRIEERWPGRVTAAWVLGVEESPSPRPPRGIPHGDLPQDFDQAPPNQPVSEQVAA
jgi:DNA-binding XRE family transcriptional regulator